MNHTDDFFASVYNNTSDCPTLEDVAQELGISRKTVKNRAGQIRRRIANGGSGPDLVWRGSPVYNSAVPGQIQSVQKPEKLSAKEHAFKRAQTLTGSVHGLFAGSLRPVINPEALVIVPHTVSRYDRVIGDYVENEGTPRTFLTETLRVESIAKPGKRGFIFTSAQNNASVDPAFWLNLNAYADAMGYEIVVGALTYETQWWDENNPASRVYDKALTPHLCFGRFEIGENFMFCGEMNTLPTANRPVRDLDAYSDGKWAVFPHNTIQLKSIPSTDPAIQAHQIMTTGSVTRPMVIPRKAGIKALDTHTLGATVVEFGNDHDLPFCRQIVADDDGSFYDWDILVKNGVVTFGHAIDALTAPDFHTAKLNPTNSLAIFGWHYKTGSVTGNSMVKELQPRYIVIHDMFDHEFRNNHHADDGAHYHEMSIRKRDSVEDEVKLSTRFLEEVYTYGAEIIVIESNHDWALEKYIRSGRYRNDGPNHRYGLTLEGAYLDYRTRVAQALDAGQKPGTFSLLEWAIRNSTRRKLDHVKWVHDGQSLIINGTEVGNHGYRGANGAKGSPEGFARLGRCITFGDKHSPSITGNAYGTGVMQLQHGYNKGPSGWAVTAAIQYRNGRRSLVTMHHGEFRPR